LPPSYPFTLGVQENSELPPKKKKKQKIKGHGDGELEAAELPLCQFGSTCYRKNPDHLREFAHPWDEAPDPKFCIAFPSISTAAFAFDMDRASTIACEVISEFLQKHKDNTRIHLYLVDISESRVLSLFRQKAPSDARLSIMVADLVQLKDYGIPCHYIVNASNTTFKGHGSGSNKAIHDACKSKPISLFKLTTAIHSPPARPGHAYLVPLPVGCPLRDTQDVHNVIHVVGPNMCPNRPHCLHGDYETGDRLLREAYQAVFDAFELGFQE